MKIAKLNIRLIILSLVTAVLLALSAIPSRFFFLSFIALIPLFFAVQIAFKRGRPFWSFLVCILISVIGFYFVVGFWIVQTAHLGYIITLLVVVPLVVLLLPYGLFFKKMPKMAPLYFISAWLSAEYVQNYFELGSPFFNLGHNLGAAPKMIQWYEYTGAAGGTLWILLVNMLLYRLINSLVTKADNYWKHGLFALSALLLPILFSLTIYYNYKEKGESMEVLVVHPSTDNADVKYRLNIYDLLEIYLDIALPHITENTEYVVLPETAITNTGWVEDYHRNLVFGRWFERTAQYPDLKLISGAIAYEAIPEIEKIKDYRRIPGIRYSEKFKKWYCTYNLALQVGQNQAVQFRTKDKLVPFQEYAPYPGIFPRLSAVGIDFQFSRREKNRQVFTSGNEHKTAALICYETVYGHLFARAARQGAEVFFVLLNEGWYFSAKKVPEQFLQFSRIRAIENRRSVAHSSNMGISAVINQRGEVVAQTKEIQSDTLKHLVYFNKERTLFSFLSYYIGLISLVIVLGLIIMFVVGKFVKNKVL